MGPGSRFFIILTAAFPDTLFIPKGQYSRHVILNSSFRAALQVGATVKNSILQGSILQSCLGVTQEGFVTILLVGLSKTFFFFFLPTVLMNL